MISIASNVNYVGTRRPYLLGISGEVLNFNSSKTSAQVKFVSNNGRVYTEWVGIGALAEVSTDPITIAKDTLKAKLAELKEKRNELQREIDELEDQIIGIDDAISALENL